MSPPSGSGSGKKVSTAAKLLGAGTSGICELALFHPVDTVAKRLMANKGAISGRVGEVIFRDAVNLSAFQKWSSLFPGVGFGGAYKVLQRTYKFGGQPVVFDYLRRNHSDTLSSRPLQQAVAGSIMGIGEVVLLPLDVLKIRMQTNPESLAGKGVVQICEWCPDAPLDRRTCMYGCMYVCMPPLTTAAGSVREEGFGLYRGIGWTIARNAPGSFALFGGNSLCKQMMGLDETMTGKATVLQNTMASTGGAVASIAVAQPLDVVKTRVQNQGNVKNPESGVTVIANLLKTEGPGAFFKGFTPKVIVVGPKLVFSMTLAQTLMRFFADTFD